MTDQRHFKCTFKGESFGRFTGSSPKQAANKALTTIIRDNGGNSKCVGKNFKFAMTECTRGCAKKSAMYEGSRTKLKNPTTIKIGDKTITYKYQNKLNKIIS